MESHKESRRAIDKAIRGHFDSEKSVFWALDFGKCLMVIENQSESLLLQWQKPLFAMSKNQNDVFLANI